MAVATLVDPLFYDHDPTPGHPESPARLEVVEATLGGFEHLALAARDASDAELTAVHDPDLVAAVRAAAGRRVRFDADTATSEGSSAAAIRAAGALLTAAEHAAAQGEAAFAFPRPPGHHAERDRIMGFCLLNNVAVAAEHARRELGARRVAVLDWDVHHGNGTQDIFYDRDDVLFLSSHQFPFYPGTGHPREKGRGAGEGYTVNVPLPAGCGDGELARAALEVFLPVLREFEPDMLFVSAGFDAHVTDPLAGLTMSEDIFGAVLSELLGLSAELCEGRLVLGLEGGYSPKGLAASVGACMGVLGGATGPSLQTLAEAASPEFDGVLEVVRGELGPAWTSLR